MHNTNAPFEIQLNSSFALIRIKQASKANSESKGELEYDVNQMKMEDQDHAPISMQPSPPPPISEITEPPKHYTLSSS